MLTFFSIVKIIAIAQLVIVCFLLLFAYGVKIYAYIHQAHCKKIATQLERFIVDSLGSSHVFNLQGLKRYKRHLSIMIATIDSLDASIKTEKWLRVRTKIIDDILLPRARIFANSRAWEKRYLACQMFRLSYKRQDQKILKNLILDEVPLVSMNAASLAIHCDSQALLDAIVDTFAKNRRVQQSLYAQIIANAGVPIIPLINNRLKREQNPYVKAFCYRSLAMLPVVSETVESVAEDLSSTNLDLKLAVLLYLCHTSPKASADLFLSLLTASDWEIRAKAAKLLGDVGDESFAPSLEPCLKDREWWVRMNAAEALAKLGAKGISILKKQDPMDDRFAYEIAQQILSTKEGGLMQ